MSRRSQLLPLLTAALALGCSDGSSGADDAGGPGDAGAVDAAGDAGGGDAGGDRPFADVVEDTASLRDGAPLWDEATGENGLGVELDVDR